MSSSWAMEQMNIEERLHQTKSTEVYTVTIAGHRYILKIFHSMSQEERDLVYDREPDPFTNERAAYIRLTEMGLCESGVVPRYHGCICNIDPRTAMPHLSSFLRDKILPNAIVIEYIPDLKMFDLTTYSKERGERFRDILGQIHACDIAHLDVWPRQMMVQTTSDRVVWLDFDCAQTYPIGSVPPYWQGVISEEDDTMDDFLTSLAHDAETGKLEAAEYYYYE